MCRQTRQPTTGIRTAKQLRAEAAPIQGRSICFHERGFLAGTAAMAAAPVGRPRFLAAAVLGSVEKNTSRTIGHI